MELKPDIVEYLKGKSLISDYDIKAQNKDRVLLENEASLGIELGIKLPTLITNLYQLKSLHDPSIAIPTFDSLKESQTPAARLYNWNMILKALDPLGLKPEEDIKSLIVAGDQQIIGDLIKTIKECEEKLLAETSENEEDDGDKKSMQSSQRLHQPTGQRGKQTMPKKKAAIDIASVSIKKDLTSIDNCLEFLLVTISKAFSLQPKQAAGLLTEGSKYLSHILIKGIKADFQPVISWLMEVYAASKHFTNLVKLEDPGNSIKMVLNSLKGGLYSKSKEVLKWTLKVLSKMSYDFTNLGLSKESWEWFISIDGGLEGCVYCLKKHPEIIPELLELMLHVGKDYLQELFTHYLKNFLNDNVQYWRSVSRFLHPISEMLPSFEAELQSSIKSLLEYFLDSCCRLADNDGRHSPDERAMALCVLTEIWVYYPEFIEAKDEIANSVLMVMKRASRDKAQALQLEALCGLFFLLQTFAESKQPHAPIIYKALAFSLVENHQNVAVRSYIMQNFIKIFTEIPAIPISIVVEPLLKQIQISENLTYSYDVSDFEFFSFIAQHSKLAPKMALQLMDILAKVLINDLLFAKMAKTAMNILVKRFLLNDNLIQEFALKFIKVALATILSQAKKIIGRKAKGNKRYPNYQAMKEAKESEHEADVTGEFLIHTLVETLIDLQNIAEPTCNEMIRETAISTNDLIKQVSKKNYEPLMELLKFYGDPAQIIETHEKEEEEKREAERKLKEEEETKRAALEAAEKAEGGEYGENNKGQERDSAKGNQLELVPKKAVAGTPLSTNSKQLVPYRSSGALGQKAMLWIDRIKKQKVDKEEQKKLVEEQLKLKLEKERKLLRQQIERRNLELGVGSKVQPEVQGGQLILKEGMLEKMQAMKQKGMSRITLINFDEEEDQTKFSIEQAIKHYKKLFKHLFDKYSNTTISKKIKAFDALKERSETMALGEFIKLLKDHKIDNIMINREEITEIVNAIKANSNSISGKGNSRVETAADHLSLYFQQYIDALIQVALFIYARPAKALSYCPYIMSVEAMMNTFQKATAARGEKTLLFTDPEAASLLPEDQKLLKELNSNPALPCPPNFKKTTEKVLQFNNRISRALPVKESIKISSEIIDDILFSSLQTHFIEYMSKVEQKTRVVPEGFKKVVARQEESGLPRYLEPIERKVKSPKASASSSVVLKPTDKLKPKLSTAMKLMIAKVPKQLQSIATNDIAPLMEEILKAVEEQRTTLAGSIKQNKAELKRKQMEEEYKKREQELERKRVQRHAQLKKEVEEKKKKAKEVEETKSKEKEEQERKDKEKKELEKAQKQKEREEMKQKLKEMKDKKEAEKKAKEDEEKAKKKEQAEIKAKEREAFLKKQNEELDKLNKDKMEKRKKDKEEEEKKEKEAAEKRARDLKKLEEQLKVDKQIMEATKKQLAELKKFCESPPASALFTKYGKHLKYLFDFYSKLEDVEIDIKLLLSTTTIQQHTFIKFAQQFGFIPHLMSSEDVNYIFKILIKDKIATGQDQMRTLNYDDFLEALVRITIAGVKKLRSLSGIAEAEGKKEAEAMSETITVDDVENLLKYMKITPDVKKTALMQRLNDLQHDKKKAKKETVKAETENAGTQIDFLKESEGSPKTGDAPASGDVGTEVKPAAEVKKVEPEKKEEKKA